MREPYASTQARSELGVWGNGHGIERLTCPDHPDDVVVGIEDVEGRPHSSRSRMASCDNEGTDFSGKAGRVGVASC